MEILSNGSQAEKTVGKLSQALGLLEDHIKLAHLEYRYEKAQSWRRLGAGAFTAFCGLSAFLFIQLAAILGLVHAGIPLYAVCIGLGGFYALGGIYIYRRFGDRDPRAGLPFQGTREEVGKSLQWIHLLLS